MYPVIPIIKEILRARKLPPMDPLAAHVSYHRCWPQDIDTFLEMNNGRILTIMDIGRTGLAERVNLLKTLRQQKWGLTVAGSSVRYRKRIRPFVKFRTVSRVVGWDHRFFYITQSIWIGPDCATQALLRTAVTDSNGIVAPDKVFGALGYTGPQPELPDWVANWIEAEGTRPWPPVDTGLDQAT